jgi:hypothetical protein
MPPEHRPSAFVVLRHGEHFDAFSVGEGLSEEGVLQGLQGALGDPPLHVLEQQQRSQRTTDRAPAGGGDRIQVGGESVSYKYTMADVTDPPDEPVQIEAGEPVDAVQLIEALSHDPRPPWEEIREITSCTGHCCRAFSLGMSPVELGQKVIASRKADDEDAAAMVLCPEHVEWISTALVYLGEHNSSPSGFPNLTLPPREAGEGPPEADEKPYHWYTCRHFVDDRCAIYEERPPVCRDYPYRGNECHNRGCTRRTTMAAGLDWHRVCDEEVVSVEKALAVDA